MIKKTKSEKDEEQSNIEEICKPESIKQAVTVLRQLNEKFYESSKKKPLFDDCSERPIFLQVTMRKIPPAGARQFVKVVLPNTLLKENTEVCLITGDTDKRNHKAEVEPDVLHFKELLQKSGITNINEVLTLRQLRLEYKPYEAKRKLAGAYDVFLCDKKIAGVLPKVLGKEFFKKRKFPIQINMDTPNLKQQVHKALSSVLFNISCKGNTCASMVANLAMNNEDIVKNVLVSVETLSKEIPGQLENIMGVYIRTEKSKAIPVYMSFGNPNDVVFKFEKKVVPPVTDELSTLDNAEVTVYPDGRVTVKRIKDEDSEEENEDNKSKNKHKKMKTQKNIEEEDETEIVQQIDENEVESEDEIVSEDEMEAV